MKILLEGSTKEIKELTDLVQKEFMSSILDMIILKENEQGVKDKNEK